MIELGSDGVLHVRPFLAVTVAIVVLFVGKAVNRRFGPLREYNIPEPVSGGLLFALAFGLVYAASGIKIDFELTARDVLLVYFFTTIGMNAQVADLRAGGRPLALLLGVTVALMLAQNLLAVSAAWLMGYRPAAGLLAGSISLLGGHGTAIAWAPVLSAEHGVAKALEVGVVCATAGLVLASLAGGPVARYLVRRHALAGPAGEALDVSVRQDGGATRIDYFAFLHAILGIHVCGVVGILANQALAAVGFKLPLFVTCLVAGILITNLLPRVAPRVPWPSRTTALALIAEVSLGVFLAMSLMSVQLWTLAEAAVPIALVLGLQLALTVLFALFVVFRVLGRNYDAAVVASGFVGYSLGATPTAMANMTAVTQRHGASHLAFLIVPLVGAFFIDLVNAFVIRLFLAAL